MLAHLRLQMMPMWRVCSRRCRVLIIEALKMENDVPAPADGTVASVNVKSGDSVKTDEVLLTLN